VNCRHRFVYVSEIIGQGISIEETEQMFAFKIGAVGAILLLCIPSISYSEALKKACMEAKQIKSSRVCQCLQKTADQTLTRSEQLRVVTFLKNPDISQAVKASERRTDKMFWS
jgi:hypothetical protein